VVEVEVLVEVLVLVELGSVLVELELVEVDVLELLDVDELVEELVELEVLVDDELEVEDDELDELLVVDVVELLDEELVELLVDVDELELDVEVVVGAGRSRTRERAAPALTRARAHALADHLAVRREQRPVEGRLALVVVIAVGEHGDGRLALLGCQEDEGVGLARHRNGAGAALTGDDDLRAVVAALARGPGRTVEATVGRVGERVEREVVGADVLRALEDVDPVGPVEGQRHGLALAETAAVVGPGANALPSWVVDTPTRLEAARQVDGGADADAHDLAGIGLERLLVADERQQHAEHRLTAQHPVVRRLGGYAQGEHEKQRSRDGTFHG
jgi:hypothetical protein